MRRKVAPLLCAIATGLSATPAQAADVTSTANELRQGYRLKLTGDCRNAIPHFVASYRLDPRPKAVLNLADCEKQTGNLLAARWHAIEGRDLARKRNDAELVAVAEEQLGALDRLLPRLTVSLAAGAPAGTQVARDGIVISSSALGQAIAVNPGAHRVTATAPGHVDREFEVTVAEEGRENLEVEPGAEVPANRGPAPSPVALSAAGSRTDLSTSTRQVLAYGALGVGVVGLGVGIAVGVVAGSKHGALETECMRNDCPPSARNDLDSFRSLRTWSSVGYVVGIVGLGTGAVLWFTASKRSSDGAARLWLGPSSAGVTGATVSRTLAQRDRLWGAERIRGELLKLGTHVAKRTVQRYMRGVRRHPRGGQTWTRFLAPRRESARECSRRRYAPRANAVCDRFLGSVRRECLDHVLVTGERRLCEVLVEYCRYFNEARPHQGIGQLVPAALGLPFHA